ncbi:MAG: glycosyltransferase family 9 protein [bacterium]|nr:glycosyltransferase family 9 protein [bacterium]
MCKAKPVYSNIAIIRLSALGDIVHAIPAFNLLRNRFPDARICWFAEPAGANLLQYVAGIDEIVVTPLKVKGIFNKWAQLKHLFSRYRTRFDLVLDFQGLLKSAVFARFLKGYTLGFGKQNLKESQARFFYSRQAEPFDENRHVIRKNMHLVHQLPPLDTDADGSPSDAVAYPLSPIPKSPPLIQFMEQSGLEENNYLIVNIGGGWESKLLTDQQYIGIIEKIKTKYPTVVLWGNEREKTVARRIADQTGVLMAPFLDFGQLILFIQQARMIVTGDTLPLHIADMVDTPSAGIFAPTSPWRNGSLLEASIPVYDDLPCGFCYKKKCGTMNGKAGPNGTIDCIKKMNIEKIIEAVELIYEKHH